MSELKEKSGVWFVYDGDCPICTYAAEALRIKEEFGSLSILNARELKAIDDPLLKEINQLGLDLDEGMVIYANERFYHGKDALKFIAKYGVATNTFMSVFKGLFWSEALSKMMYPWMRGCRNWLLRRKNSGRIDNLKLAAEPTFKAIFGDSWDSLPPIMKKHYANHPYSSEVTSVDGVLDVYCKPPLVWFAPLMKLLGQIPAVNENRIPVTVRFESDPNSKAFHFNRCFYLPGRAAYIFHSRMLQIHNNTVVEIMRYGFTWKMEYSWDGEKIILKHKGYAIQILGHLIPLPLTILLGAGHAVEHPIDDDTFDMEVSIIHPWWGAVYGYKGRFLVSN